MANPNLPQRSEPDASSPSPAEDSGQVAGQPADTSAKAVDPDYCPDTARVRIAISRLERELAARQADSRPLPSSVIRAFEAVIDKQYAEIDRLAARNQSGTG